MIHTRFTSRQNNWCKFVTETWLFRAMYVKIVHELSLSLNQLPTLTGSAIQIIVGWLGCGGLFYTII